MKTPRERWGTCCPSDPECEHSALEVDALVRWMDTPISDEVAAEHSEHECPAGGLHDFEFVTAADQQDDTGRRFHSGWFCAECGASPPREHTVGSR